MIIKSMRLFATVCVLFITNASGMAQEAVVEAGKQPVKIQEIRIKGSRLPEKSILHLTGLQVGQTIEETKVRSALQHANDSGLFTNIGYTYESLPDSTNVILELQIVDQLPLVPATIKIPKIDAEQIWQYLQNFDPLLQTNAWAETLRSSESPSFNGEESSIGMVNSCEGGSIR